MTAARLGRRQTQNEEIASLKKEIQQLRAENAQQQAELLKWHEWYARQKKN